MTTNPTQLELLAKLLREEPRFSPEAYGFVQVAVAFTQKHLKRQRPGGPHITGMELLAGVRELALHQFGPMAGAVLREWGIESTLDVGTIVFALVRHGVLTASQEDRLDAFRDVFDFDAVFGAPFRPTRAAPIPPGPQLL